MENDYRLGEWTVRSQRGCIERGDDVVHLKPKVMAVLHCLASAGGNVVTRDVLFETVWPGGVVSDATLTQCVVELRSAFDDSARQPEFIETVPKVGFRLIPEVREQCAGQVGAPEMQANTTATGGSILALRKSRTVLIGIVSTLIILVLFWYQTAVRNPVPPSDERGLKSVAVLPFADVSKDQDQGWFADGLTDEMIGRLSQLEGLNVTGRTASFYFKDRSAGLAQISKELGVEYILEGGVRKDDDQLRITAQLIQPGIGLQLWSEQFDRPIEDVFDVQAEIAESIAIALAITLDVGKFAGDPLATSSVEAYEEGLKSQHAHREFTADSLLRAIHHARRAVEIDPEYGYAWYGLASLYREAGTFKGVIAKEDWMQLAVEALDRATALDPDPDAGIWEKVTLATLDHRWTDAQELLGPLTGREMVEDDPRNFQYAYFLYHVGRVREATLLMEHWKRLHPGGQGTHSGLAVMYTAQERYETAFAEVEKAYEIGGYSEFSALSGVIAALCANDRYQLSRWTQSVIEHTEGEGIAFWPAMNDALDDPLVALAYLRSLDSDELAYAASLWAAWHGDVDLALQAMRRSDTTFAFWIPLMKDVRRHPGFKDLVRDRNLVEYWREYGWADLCKPVGEDDFECE